MTNQTKLPLTSNSSLIKSSAMECDLPQWMLDEIERLLEDLPARIPRKRAAEIVSKHVFETSHRTMERWPLPVRHLNGQAHFETRDVLMEAFRRLHAAPVLSA